MRSERNTVLSRRGGVQNVESVDSGGARGDARLKEEGLQEMQ